MNEIEQSLVVASCCDLLLAQGIKVSVEADYSRIPKLVAESRHKKYLTPQLDPRRNDFSSSNYLWLSGLDEGGIPVLLGGARLEALGSRSIRDYWPDMMRRLYADTIGEEIITNVSPLLADTLRGHLCYFGDLYCDPSARGRKRINVQAFTMIGHLITRQRWGPDFTYAIMRRDDIMRGNGSASCFSHEWRKPFEWLQLPDGYSGRESCVWSSEADVQNNARQLHEDVEAAIEEMM